MIIIIRMNSRRLLFSIILILLCSFPSYAIISDIYYGAAVNFIHANACWDIYFPDKLNDGTSVFGRSKLEYCHLNNLGLSLLLNLTLFDYICLEIDFLPSFLTINLQNGNGYDSDYFQEMNSSPTRFSRSSFDNKNSPTHLNIKSIIKITAFSIDNKPLILKYIMGFQRHVENITMSDGLQLESNNSQVTEVHLPPAGASFPSLQSTYQFDWDVLEAGLGLHYKINSSWEIKSITAVLYNFYSGEGFWNLRTNNSYPDEYAWRNESPNFIHYNGTGLGMHLGLELIFPQPEGYQFIFKYNYIYQNAENGKEKLYFYHSEYNKMADDVTVENISYHKNIFSFGIINKF